MCERAGKQARKSRCGGFPRPFLLYSFVPHAHFAFFFFKEKKEYRSRVEPSAYTQNILSRARTSAGSPPQLSSLWRVVRSECGRFLLQVLTLPTSLSLSLPVFFCCEKEALTRAQVGDIDEASLIFATVEDSMGDGADEDPSVLTNR